MPRSPSDRKFPTKKKPNASNNPFNLDGLLRRLSFRADSAFFEGPRAQAEVSDVLPHERLLCSPKSNLQKLKKRKTLYDRKMPNSANGVRGGPSKRPDPKKNPEHSSFDSQGSSRRNTEEPQSPIDVLAYSSEALQRLAEFAGYFGSPSFKRDMQMVEDDYGAEITKESKIKKLEETVASLVHVKSEETEKLRRENKQLMDEQEDCQQEKKKALEIQKKVEDQHTLAEASRQKESEQKLQDERAKAAKAAKTKRAELEDEYKKKGRELDEKLSKLLAANVDLKQRCKEADEKLEMKKTRHARIEKSLEDDNKKLTEELKQLQAQFPVEEQGIEY